jgi:hypothetical protein
MLSLCTTDKTVTISNMQRALRGHAYSALPKISFTALSHTREAEGANIFHEQFATFTVSLNPLLSLIVCQN